MLKDCEQTSYTDCQKAQLPEALKSLKLSLDYPELTFEQAEAQHKKDNLSKLDTAQKFANFLENEHYWMYEPPIYERPKGLFTSLFGSTAKTEYFKKDKYFIEAKPYFTKIIEDKTINKNDKNTYLPNETDTFNNFLEKDINLHGKLHETAADVAKSYKDISDKYFEANYVEDAKIIPGDDINTIKVKHSQLLAKLDKNDDESNNKKVIYKKIYDNILQSATNYNTNYNNKKKISLDNYVKAANMKDGDDIETITEKHDKLLKGLHPTDKNIATYTEIYNKIKTEMNELNNKTKSQNL